MRAGACDRAATIASLASGARRPAICAGLFAAAALTAALTACKGDSGCRNCNVILISLDTLRADRLGAYGYERDTSPVIDEFAAGSVVFLDALTQYAATLESHRSLFTGLLASADDDPPSIAEILREHGYRTAAFTGGGLLHRRFGFARGFDEYHDSLKQAGLASVNPLVMDWLRRNHDSRFFLFLHTYDVHCPYTPPEPYHTMFSGDHRPSFTPRHACGSQLTRRKLNPSDVEYVSATYDGGVRWTDTQLGLVLGELELLGLDENTVVIIVSDHGEALGEGGFFGHGMFREEAHRVPLIVRVPGYAPGVNREPVQLVDVMPMVLGLIGIEAPAGLDGADLGPILRGESSFDGHRPRLSMNPLGEVMFRVGDGFVLIDRTEPREDELYDLGSDWRDVASEHPDRVARLQTQLAEFRRLRHAGPSLEAKPPPNLDEVQPALREQLRTLGYVE